MTKLPPVLHRAPFNPRPGYTLPQLIEALNGLPQSRDTPRAPDSTVGPHSGLRLLVRVEGSYVELPILAITESLVPDGSTLVLHAGEPVPARPHHRQFMVAAWTPTPHPSLPLTVWRARIGPIEYEIEQRHGEAFQDLLADFAARHCDPASRPS